MDSPWQRLVEGRTTLDPATGRLVARMWILPHRHPHPPFAVSDFSDPTVILAHVGARLDLPDYALHVDFAPLVHHSPASQDWTVWRDAPWPALDTLMADTPHPPDDPTPDAPAAHLLYA